MSKTALPLMGKDKLVSLIFLAEERQCIYTNTNLLRYNRLIFQKYVLWGMGSCQRQLFGILLYNYIAQSLSWKVRLSSAYTILHRYGTKSCGTGQGHGCTSFPTIVSPSAVLTENAVPLKYWVRCQIGSAADTGKGKPKELWLKITSVVTKIEVVTSPLKGSILFAFSYDAWKT